ncbi:PepSY domain-containing protein [Labrys neptuniae]
MKGFTASSSACAGLILTIASMASPIEGALAGSPHRGPSPGVVIRRPGAHSFKEISAAVARETPGRILRIRELRRGGRQLYMVRVLRSDGKRRDVLLDAVTLAPVDK